MRWALCCPLFVGLVLPKLFDLAWLVADTKYHPCRYAIFFLFPSPPVPNMSADTPRKGRDPEDRNEVESLGLKWQAAYHLDLQMVTMLRPRRADAGHSSRPWDRVWHACPLSLFIAMCHCQVPCAYQGCLLPK